MITVDNLQFELFIPEAEVRRRIAEVARRIEEDYAGRTPVLIGILNGAFIFAADLVRELGIGHEIHFAKVASYEGTESTGCVRELIGVDVPLEGRDVIVVEDIVDTGYTMAHLLESLKRSGARSVEVCTLLMKPGKLRVPLSVKYCAMEIPNEFILGYGLDYNNLGRGMKDIYRVCGGAGSQEGEEA